MDDKEKQGVTLKPEFAPGYKVPVLKGTRIKNPVERMDDPWKALKRFKEEEKEEEEEGAEKE